jgi:hypothetical protein
VPGTGDYTAGARHRRLHRGLRTVEDTLAALEMARSVEYKPPASNSEQVEAKTWKSPEASAGSASTRSAPLVAAVRDAVNAS